MNRHEVYERGKQIQRFIYLFCIGIHIIYYLLDPNQTNLLRSAECSMQFKAIRYVIELVLIPALCYVTLIDLINNEFGLLKLIIAIVGFTICMLVSGGLPDFNLLTLYWLIVACPTIVSDEDIANTVYVIGLFFSALTIAFALSGDIPNIMRYEHGVLRFGMGFFRDFYFSANMTALISVWVYSQLRTWRSYKYALAFSAGLVVYTIGNGRIAFIVLIIQLVGIALWRMTASHQPVRSLLFHLTQILAATCPLLLAGLSLYLSVYVDVAKMDLGSLSGLFKEFFSGRVVLWNRGIEEVGLSLFGGAGKPSMTFDNTYLLISVTYGLFFIFIACMLHGYCCRKLCKPDDYYLLLYAFSMGLLAFTMRYLNYPALNHTILFFAVRIAQDVKRRPLPRFKLSLPRFITAKDNRRNRYFAIVVALIIAGIITAVFHVVSVIDKPRAVSAGYAHTVAAFRDGTVSAVGRNDHGQCNVGRWRNITRVSAGHLHTIGVMTNGCAVAEGDNSYGQCEINDWSNIQEVSAGFRHTVGLRADGTVIAAGSKEYGRCDVDDWSDVISIAAGGAHTIALCSDGRVLATGLNTDKRCDVSSWNNVVAIDAGYRHTVALRNDGTVYASGNNDFGQCDVGDWTDVVAISAGYNHTLGIRSDGTILATGNNEDNECGVEEWSDILSVTGGGRHTIAIKQDGTFLACGSNKLKQCQIRNNRIIRPYPGNRKSAF